MRRLPVPKGKAPSVGAPLMGVARRDDVPPGVRVEALAAVPKDSLALTPELFAFLAAQVGPEQPVAVRVTAADVLGRARLTPQQLASLADAVKTAGPLEIGRLLGAYDQSSDEEAGMKLVAALASSKAARSLRADMVQPRLAKFSPAVRKAAEPLLASLNPDAGAQRQKLEQMLASLPKGDVRKGQVVFNGKQAACSTCHAIGYIGGHVGPDLTRVGATRAERDLLESIVFPSASFVQTYEPVLVDTKSGDRQSGILKRNDADEVVLLTGPDLETHIPRKDVAEMRPSPISVMPAGLDQQLSPQDLADLVAFLKACQ
jgi:putative heme-binding domain-containing protein